MHINHQLPFTALAAITLTLGACSDSTAPGSDRPLDPAARGARADEGGVEGNPALSFNGLNANASTAIGTVATTQIENMIVDAMVKFNGANAANAGQGIFYNGHGAWSGWGILALGADAGAPTGTLAILAGGITVAQTPLVLTPGKWQHITVERSFGGRTTVALDDQVVDMGLIPVAAVGTSHAAIERTTIGGSGLSDAPSADFNGVIDDVHIVDLTSHNTIESWTFDEARGTTTRGTNGTVLSIGNATWVRDDNKAKDHGEGDPSLLFNGVDANTSTPFGTVATTQTDNMAVDVTVTFGGAKAGDAAQMLYYNGHGGHAGWGILILGAADGFPTGTITILAGGIAVVPTPLVLAPGRPQHVRVTRGADGHMIVALNDQSADIGFVGVNPVPQGSDSRTSLGGDGTFNAPGTAFNGTISDLRMSDLGTSQTIEHWSFSEGSGAIATGDNGTLLFLGNTTWTRHGGGD